MTRKRAKRAYRRATRRIRRFRRGKQPISILTAAPVMNAAIIQPLYGDGATMGGAMPWIQTGQVAEAAREYLDILGINFMGFKFSDQSLWLHQPIKTYGTMILGALGSKLATRLGANRQFARIPFLGKYVKL